MSEFLRDVRFGWRLLASNPGFAITATLLLAIGISANALIFSVTDALLLRPLPVPHPENLVRLVEVHPNGFVTWNFPDGICRPFGKMQPAIAETICQGEADVAFTEGGVTERVSVHLVSPNFFSTLGVRPVLGRLLTPDDDRTAAPNAVLSYDFWQHKFGRNAAVIGRSIALGGRSFTIVGVSPSWFHGLSADTGPDLRVPRSVEGLIAPQERFAEVFGRLRPEASLRGANAEVNQRLRQAYEDLFPKPAAPRQSKTPYDSQFQLEAIPNGVSALRGQFSRGLEMLMASVAMLLLLACANVAGLLLARSAARNQEIGIRLAIGASPGRIVRQLLTEGGLLAMLGGAAGLLLTQLCLPLVVSLLPALRDRGAVLRPLEVQVSIDGRVLGFAVLVTLLTTILFALSPALRVVQANLAGTLRASRSTGPQLARVAIVTAQIAICTMLLLGAALLVQTLRQMRLMNPGFDKDHVVTFSIDPDVRGYTPEQSRAFSKALLDRASALPGVSAAAIASRGLMRGTGVKATIGLAGAQLTPADFLNASLNDVTPGYFESMGMHIVTGRDFLWSDPSGAKPRKTIVNQAFVARFLPGRDPLGQRFGNSGGSSIASGDNVIIGVVNDAKYRSLREPIPPTIYNPVTNGFDSSFILHLRTRQRPADLIAPVRGVLRSLDPRMPLIEARTLNDEVEASLWQERLLAWLSAAFGMIAVLLASVGLYGALDYAVKARTREIGVRVAVGASPGRVVGMLSRETAMPVMGGLTLGLGLYAAASVWLRQVLFQVPLWEPAAIAFVTLLVIVMGAIAATPAILRALRIDPATALRVE